MFIPHPGVTFLIRSDKGYHLNFILTFPIQKEQSEEVLVVGITSTKVDEKFTLSRGDHPFIKHKSYINYPQAQIIPVKTIEQGWEEEFIPKETAHGDIVKHICKGLRESQHSLPGHRDFCRKACKD